MGKLSLCTKRRMNLPYGADVKTVSGCSKRPSSKAAGESKPEAYPQGYVEDFDESRTKLAEFFSILLGAFYYKESYERTNRICS